MNYENIILKSENNVSRITINRPPLNILDIKTMSEIISALKEIREQKTIKGVVFTGAGISTESGIPDYRSQGGIWDKFRPVYFNEFMSSKDSRIEYWQRWHDLYRDLTDAGPNTGHQAFAELYQMGMSLRAIVRQTGWSQPTVWDSLTKRKVPTRKGHKARGEIHYCAKLNARQVAEIRRRAMDGEVPHQLAQEYGVSGASVLQIIKHKTWKHVS